MGRLKVTGGRPATNGEYNERYLDCAVIQAAHKRAEERYSKSFDTVVGPFGQGSKIYESAMLCDFDHMQICVANQNKIKGCFYERIVDQQSPVL